MALERIETPDQKQSRKIQADSAAQHRENIRRNIQRRLDVAQAEGNETLVSQLVKELDQL